ncbi:PilZ domain-containing protein [Thalassotalea fusca]
MSVTSDKSKLEQFQEFFSIEHQFSINIKPLAQAHVSYQEFLRRIPLPFKMSTDINTLDQSALRPLQTLGSVAGQLVEYLNHQSQKIDLLVGYIINQQDEQDFRFLGTKFGGSGIEFEDIAVAPSFTLGEHVELKLFFPLENSAIYCHGEIIEIVAPEADDTPNRYRAIFTHIREEDREIIVRASLHQQSRQLQEKAQQRTQAINNED